MADDSFRAAPPVGASHLDIGHSGLAKFYVPSGPLDPWPGTEGRPPSLHPSEAIEGCTWPARGWLEEPR